MNTVYVLMVVIVFGSSPPRPATLTQEFSSKDTCETAKQEVTNQVSANAPSFVGSSAKVFVATCTPK